jgi:hypothetical protein
MVITRDGAGLTTVYIDGVTWGSTTSNGVFSFYRNYRESIEGFTGVLYKLALFNTALTATQAQEIYEQGVSGWLAANPEYKWGVEAAQITTSAVNSTDVTRQFASITAASPTGVTATYNNANSTNCVGWQLDVPFVAGQLYRLTGNIQSNGGGLIDILTANNANFSALSTIQTLTPDGDFEVLFISSFTPSFIFFRSNAPAASGDLVVSDLDLKKAGCLSHLPMDEGIGYQLHDQSTNHHDALLSETGCTHLQPKREGFVRDFSVDAYNGGGAPVELVSSSRDVLQGISSVTEVTVKNNSNQPADVTIQRSNRSTQDAGMGITNIFAGGITTAAFTKSQITWRRNILVSSADTDATDLDIRVDYKLID